MSGNFLVRNSDNWQIKPTQNVVKASDFSKLCQVSELLEQVKKQSLDIKDKAEEIYKDSFEKGVLEGRAEGKEEYAEKIMDMVLSQVESIEALESQLVGVVIDAVTKIIGEFDPKDRVLRVVKQALNSVRGSKSITLKVCAQDEKLLRTNLSSYLLNSDGSKGYITLVSDPNLRSGDCILETEQGVVDSSLQSQLKILQKVLNDHVVRKS